MEYSRLFCRQWQKLVDEFVDYTATCAMYGFDIQRLNSWYKDNAFRWKSIASAEGELLNTQEDLLKKNLLNKIDGFSFTEANKLKRPGFLVFFLPFLLAGIFVGIMANVKLNLSVVISIIIGLVISLIGGLVYAKCLGGYERKEKKYLVDEYSGQLKKLGEILCDICKEYEKN